MQEEHPAGDDRLLPEELPAGERPTVSCLQTGRHRAGRRGEVLGNGRGGAAEHYEVFTRRLFHFILLQFFFFLRFVLHFPAATTGGRDGHPDQVGLQPGPADAALPPQVLLQEAGREGEQQDALPRPQLPVSQRVKGHFRVTSRLGEHAVTSLCRDSYAKYNTVNGVEERTLFKAFGIRFDVMVFGQVGSSPLPVFTPLGLFKM